MSVKSWLQKNTVSLSGKTVAVTGSTGALGRELCRYLAGLEASLVLVDRNAERSAALRAALQQEFPKIRVSCVSADLSDMQSVKAACAQLKTLPLDVFIHNAGAYAIPRKTCDTGLDNVFQINFVSPYYLIRELLPTLRARHGRVVIVSSIAHDFVKSDPKDIDFSTRTRASKVYGNAKRYLTFSLVQLFAKEREVTLSVTHPGISLTGITAHYPKLIFALIKYPMKVIFMRPKKACLSILRGVFEPTEQGTWIGPCCFNVWGYPKKKRLQTASEEEQAQIAARACEIYERIR